MVKKSNLLEKLKTRWKTGVVRVEDHGRNIGPHPVRDSVAARVDPSAATAEPPVADNGTTERTSGRKMSPREEVTVALGEGFRELSNMVRGLQARVEDNGSRTSDLAGDVKMLPQVGRQQLDLLRRMADQMEKQGQVGEKLLETLSGVQEAIDRAAATDERTATTLSEFRSTMERIEGAMGKMVESNEAHAKATSALSKNHKEDQDELVEAIRSGRRQDVETLAHSQREGVERIEAATAKRFESMQKLQSRQADDLTKLVTQNGKWTRAMVVLLGLTVLGLGGILVVLAL